MNAAHFHLIMVHIPIVLIPTALMIVLIGLWKSNQTVLQTAYVIFFVTALAVVPAFLSGEEAEEIVEHLPQISEKTIENHEEAADFSLWLTVSLGVLGLAGIFVTRRQWVHSRKLGAVVIVLATVTAGSLSYTAFQGGKIRHPEAYEHMAESGGANSAEGEK